MSHRNVSCQVFFHVVHAFLVGKYFPKKLNCCKYCFIFLNFQEGLNFLPSKSNGIFSCITFIIIACGGSLVQHVFQSWVTLL